MIPGGPSGETKVRQGGPGRIRRIPGGRAERGSDPKRWSHRGGVRQDAPSSELAGLQTSISRHTRGKKQNKEGKRKSESMWRREQRGGRSGRGERRSSGGRRCGARVRELQQGEASQPPSATQGPGQSQPRVKSQKVKPESEPESKPEPNQSPKRSRRPRQSQCQEVQSGPLARELEGGCILPRGPNRPGRGSRPPAGGKRIPFPLAWPFAPGWSGCCVACGRSRRGWGSEKEIVFWNG